MEDQAATCLPAKTASKAPTSIGSPNAVPVPCISMLVKLSGPTPASARASLKTCRERCQQAKGHTSHIFLPVDEHLLPTTRNSTRNLSIKLPRILNSMRPANAKLQAREATDIQHLLLRWSIGSCQRRRAAILIDCSTRKYGHHLEALAQVRTRPECGLPSALVSNQGDRLQMEVLTWFLTCIRPP